MAIRRSVGCSCCGPVEKTCCSLTYAKPYPTSFTEVTSPFGTQRTFQTTDQTNWADGWSGDVPQNIIEDDPSTLDATPNTLPANSTVSFEINLCCLDYLVEVEIMDIDALDDETEIRVGGMRWNAIEGNKSLFINGLNWEDNDDAFYQSKNHGVQMMSYLDNGSMTDRVISNSMSLRNPDSPLLVNTSTSQDYYLNMMYRYKVGAAHKSGATRKAKVTITTGQYPVTIGGVVIQTGTFRDFLGYSFTGGESGASTTEDCVWPAISGNTSHIGNLGITDIGIDNYLGCEVIYGGEATIAGYGTVNVTEEREGTPYQNAGIFDPHPDCPSDATPSYSLQYEHDFSVLNGTYQNVLCYRSEYKTDTTVDHQLATLDDLLDLAALHQRVVDGGEFTHDDEIMHHWKFEWKMPLVGGIMGSTGYAQCVGDFSDYASCEGDPVPANGSGSYSYQNFGGIDWAGSTNDDPCLQSLPYVSPFTVQSYTGFGFLLRNIDCYGSSSTSAPASANYYANVPHPSVTAAAPTTSFKACATDTHHFHSMSESEDFHGPAYQYSSANHPWFTSSFSDFDPWFESLPVVWPITSSTPYDVFGSNIHPLYTASFDNYDPDWPIEHTESMTQRTATQSSSTDSYTGTTDGFSWTNTCTVTGDFTATHDANYKSTRLPDHFSMDNDHEAYTKYWKIYDGVVSEFNFSKVTRDADLNVTATVNVSQDGASQVPTDLVEDLYDPFFFSETYRGSSDDVNDGKIYGNEVEGVYDSRTDKSPTEYNGNIGFLLHRVPTDDTEEWMIKFPDFGENNFKIFHVDGNEQYSFSSSNRTVTHFDGCTPSEVELTSGTDGAEGDYIVVNFKISGTK